MNSDSYSTSRRAALKAGIAVIAGTSVAALATRASAQSAQAAPASVAYQTKPNNGAQCSGCVQFVPPNACKIVSGVIAADGWCELYSPKS
ncbi:MAG TPA: high-potential iron-sulfur protein [Acidocella sp.]|nr:MAG: hypothetical protein B7Y73_06560 [Acidocella sp. 35-58-6]HQT38134.1 high-potential iron-sulfur protein [Acidocella sp.]